MPMDGGKIIYHVCRNIHSPATTGRARVVNAHSIQIENFNIEKEIDLIIIGQ